MSAKVRWSQFCAGGCFRWLVVGTRAAHMHRGWWCKTCTERHKRICRAHDLSRAERPVVIRDALL